MELLRYLLMGVLLTGNFTCMAQKVLFEQVRMHSSMYYLQEDNSFTYKRMYCTYQIRGQGEYTQTRSTITLHFKKYPDSLKIGGTRYKVAGSVLKLVRWRKEFLPHSKQKVWIYVEAGYQRNPEKSNKFYLIEEFQN